MSKYAELEKTRTLAYKIVDKIHYPNGIKSHSDFAKRINQAGEIARMIENHNKI